MKTIKLRLVLAVEFDPQGATVQDLTSELNQVVRDAVNNGTLTGDSPATVEKYEYTVKEVKSKAKAKKVCRKCGTPLNSNGLCKDQTCPFSDKRERRKAGQHRFADCGGYPRCVTCGRDEDDAFVGGEDCTFGK